MRLFAAYEPNTIFFTTLSLFLTACALEPPPLTPLPTPGAHENRTPLDPAVQAEFWKVKDAKIVDGSGSEVILRGIAFGNQVWDHVAIPSAHHTRVDFERVARLGMNTVRFYLSYRTFEDDDAPGRYKQSGWDWIDQNVQWAKEHGVRLVLNMHAPVGGYQSGGEGDALWENERNQERFIQLWQAIADRYRAEPVLAGFDLLNEPVPTKDIEQWKNLAERTISAIRAVDQHHMIFVERVNAVGSDWSENAQRNFFLVTDPNVVYEFHFYKPYHFTHQGASWSEFAAREAWYPDKSAVAVDWFELESVARAESKPLPAGNSPWSFVETEPYQVDDPELQVGKPFLVCDRAEGKVTFDSLSLTKWVEGVSRPETVFEIDLDTLRGWYFWTENGAGSAHFEPKGQGDETALSIAGTTGAANLGSDPLRFPLEVGTSYQLHALSKGEQLGPSSRCLLRLEFFSAKVPVFSVGKDFLEFQLNQYRRWASDQGVPLYLGEFGTIRESFNPGRGGIVWVRDMLDTLIEHDTHFSYHTYHENPFGLFTGEGSLPQEAGLNRPLHDLFVDKLGGRGFASDESAGFEGSDENFSEGVGAEFEEGDDDSLEVVD